MSVRNLDGLVGKISRQDFNTYLNRMDKLYGKKEQGEEAEAGGGAAERTTAATQSFSERGFAGNLIHFSYNYNPISLFSPTVNLNAQGTKSPAQVQAEEARSKRNRLIAVVAFGFFVTLGLTAVYAYKVVPQAISAEKNYYLSARVSSKTEDILQSHDSAYTPGWDKAFLEKLRVQMNPQRFVDAAEQKKWRLYDKAIVSMIAGGSAMIIGGVFASALVWKLGLLAIIFGSVATCYNFFSHLGDANNAELNREKSAAKKQYNTIKAFLDAGDGVGAAPGSPGAKLVLAGADAADTGEGIGGGEDSTIPGAPPAYAYTAAPSAPVDDAPNPIAD